MSMVGLLTWVGDDPTGRKKRIAVLEEAYLNIVVPMDIRSDFANRQLDGSVDELRMCSHHWCVEAWIATAGYFVEEPKSHRENHVCATRGPTPKLISALCKPVKATISLLRSQSIRRFYAHHQSRSFPPLWEHALPGSVKQSHTELAL